ncbi:MAG TPA: YdeI/OmpD-associated family protein [Flavitalea sp.]|nr:YdeI/OmpD-associated family protein [Flavitalea sp.]
MEKPLVNKKYKLEKFPGKGGWTYTVISEIPPDKRERFGWVKVKGLIDDFELKGYHLMPMANGKLFLPVRAEIRKKIKKQEGDWVKVVLFQDTEPLFIPDEFLQCLRDEPAAYKTFHSYTESSKKYYVDWIYSSKKVETRIERMAQAIDRLARGLNFTDSLKMK